jgi:manganese transport protein
VKAPFDKAGLRRAAELPGAIAVHLPAPEYRIILVPLDHSIRDRIAITHAAALARNYGAKLYLLHVEEDVTSQIYGAMASTAEVTAGQEYLDALTGSLQLRGVEVEKVVRFSPSPKAEIVRYANELKPDLIVMGAHGHKGLKDIIFGTTINALRHKVHIPLLIVRDPDW